VDVDVAARKAVFSAGAKKRTVSFKLSEFESALIEAGGWVEFAARKY
jgi:hypothetical protein